MLKNEVKSRKFCDTDDYITMEYLLKREGSRLNDSHIPIIRRLITIGRSPNCTITLKSIRVSRMQCEIIYRDENIFLRDTQSSNGTFVNNEKLTNEMRKLEIGDFIGFGVNPYPKRIYDSNQFVFSLQRYQSEQSVEIADDDNADGKLSVENIDHTYNLDPVDNLTLKTTNSDDFMMQYEFGFFDDDAKPQSRKMLINCDYKYEKPTRDSLLNLFSESDNTNYHEALRLRDYTSQYENKGLSVESCETVGITSCDITEETENSAKRDEILFIIEDFKDLKANSRSLSENLNAVSENPLNYLKARSFSTSAPKAESALKKGYSSSPKTNKTTITLRELLERPAKLEETKMQSLQNSANQGLNAKSSNSVSTLLTKNSTNLRNKRPETITSQSCADIPYNLVDIASTPIDVYGTFESVIKNNSIALNYYDNLTDNDDESEKISKIITENRNIVEKLNSANKSSFDIKAYEANQLQVINVESKEQSKTACIKKSTKNEQISQLLTLESKNRKLSKVLDPKNQATESLNKAKLNKTIKFNKSKTRTHKAIQSVMELAERIKSNKHRKTQADMRNLISSEQKLSSIYKPAELSTELSPDVKHKRLNSESETRNKKLSSTEMLQNLLLKSSTVDASNQESSSHVQSREDIRNSSLLAGQSTRHDKGSKAVKNEQTMQQKPVVKQQSFTYSQIQHNSLPTHQVNPNKSSYQQPHLQNLSQVQKIGPTSSQNVSMTSTSKKNDHVIQPKTLKHVKHTSKPFRVRRTDAEIDRDLELYSKKLANSSNQLNSKSASHKVEKLVPKNEVISIKKLGTIADDSVILNVNKTQNIDKATQPRSAPHSSSQKAPEIASNPDQKSRKDSQSSSEQNTIKKSKLSPSDIVGIKEICLKAVEEIKKKDQEVAQEFEREITKVLKIVSLSDEDEILDEKSGVFVKKECVKKSVEPQNLVGNIDKLSESLAENKELYSIHSNLKDQNVQGVEVQNDAETIIPITTAARSEITFNPIVSSLNIQSGPSFDTNGHKGASNIPKTLTITENSITMAPTLITTVPVFLGTTNIPQNNSYGTTSSFTPVFPAPVPFRPVNQTSISITHPNINPVIQHGYSPTDVIYNQRSITNFSATPENYSQNSTSCAQSLVNLARQTEYYAQKSINYSQVPVNFTYTQPSNSSFNAANTSLLLTKPSSVISHNPQTSNFYSQNLNQVHLNPFNYVRVVPAPPTVYLANQVPPSDQEIQPNSNKKSYIEDHSHDSTEEVTILNLEPARRTLSISNLLEASKMIAMNNNDDSDDLYSTSMNDLFFPQNVDDDSPQNTQFSSLCLQSNLLTEKSQECSVNDSKTGQDIKNKLGHSESFKNDSTIAIETNPGIEISKKDEINDLINGSIDTTNCNSAALDDDIDDEDELQDEATETADRPEIRKPFLTDDDNMKFTTTDQLFDNIQNSQKTQNNNKITLKQKNDKPSNEINADENLHVHDVEPIVEVDEDVQSFDDSESVLNKTNKKDSGNEALVEENENTTNIEQKSFPQALDSLTSQISASSLNLQNIHNNKSQISAAESVAETDLDWLEVSSFGSINDQEESSKNCHNTFKSPEPWTQKSSPESSRLSRNKATKSNVNSSSFQLLILNSTVRRSKRKRKPSKKMMERLTENENKSVESINKLDDKKDNNSKSEAAAAINLKAKTNEQIEETVKPYKSAQKSSKSTKQGKTKMTQKLAVHLKRTEQNPKSSQKNIKSSIMQEKSVKTFESPRRSLRNHLNVEDKTASKANQFQTTLIHSKLNESFEARTSEISKADSKNSIKTIATDNKEHRLRSAGKISEDSLISVVGKTNKNDEFEKSPESCVPQSNLLNSLLLNSLDILSNELLENRKKINTVKEFLITSSNNMEDQSHQKSTKILQNSAHLKPNILQNKVKNLLNSRSSRDLQSCIKTRSSERLTTPRTRSFEPISTNISKILHKRQQSESSAQSEPVKPTAIDKLKKNSKICAEQSPKVNNPASIEDQTQATLYKTSKIDEKFNDQNVVKIPLNDTAQPTTDEYKLSKRVLRSRSKSVDTLKDSLAVIKITKSRVSTSNTSDIDHEEPANGNDDKLLNIKENSAKNAIAKFTSKQLKPANQDKLSKVNFPKKNKEILVTDEPVRNLRNRYVPINSSHYAESNKNSEPAPSLPKFSSSNNQGESASRSKSVDPPSQSSSNDLNITFTSITAASTPLKDKDEEKSVRSLRSRLVFQVEATNLLNPETEKLTKTKQIKIDLPSETKVKDGQNHSTTQDSKAQCLEINIPKQSNLESSNQLKTSFVEDSKLSSSTFINFSASPVQPSKPSFSSVFLPRSVKTYTKAENLPSNQVSEESIVRRLRERPKTSQSPNKSLTEQEHSNIKESTKILKKKDLDNAQQALNDFGEHSNEAKKQRLENAIINKLLTINLTSLRSRKKSTDLSKSSEPIKAQKLEEPLTHQPSKHNSLIKRSLTGDNLDLLKKLSIRSRKHESININKPTQPVKSIREQLLESQRRSRSAESSKEIHCKVSSENETSKDKEAFKSHEYSSDCNQPSLNKPELTLQPLVTNETKNNEGTVETTIHTSEPEITDQQNIEEFENNDNQAIEKTLEIKVPDHKIKSRSINIPSISMSRHQTRLITNIIEYETQNELDNKINSSTSEHFKGFKPYEPESSVLSDKTISKTVLKQTLDLNIVSEPLVENSNNQEVTFNRESTSDPIESTQLLKASDEIKECFVNLQRLTSHDITKFTKRSRSLSISTRSNHSSMSSPERPLSLKSSFSSEQIIRKRMNELISSSSRRSSSDSNSDIVPLINLIHRPNLRSESYENSKILYPNENFKESPLSSSVRTLLRHISDEKTSNDEITPNLTRKNIFGTHKKSMDVDQRIYESSDDDYSLQKYANKFTDGESISNEVVHRPTRSRFTRTKTISETEVNSTSVNINTQIEIKSPKQNDTGIIENLLDIDPKTTDNGKVNKTVSLDCNQTITSTNYDFIIESQNNCELNKSSEINKASEEPKSINFTSDVQKTSNNIDKANEKRDEVLAESEGLVVMLDNETLIESYKTQTCHEEQLPQDGKNLPESTQVHDSIDIVITEAESINELELAPSEGLLIDFKENEDVAQYADDDISNDAIESVPLNDPSEENIPEVVSCASTDSSKLKKQMPKLAPLSQKIQKVKKSKILKNLTSFDSITDDKRLSTDSQELPLKRKKTSNSRRWSDDSHKVLSQSLKSITNYSRTIKTRRLSCNIENSFNDQQTSQRREYPVSTTSDHQSLNDLMSSAYDIETKSIESDSDSPKISVRPIYPSELLSGATKLLSMSQQLLDEFESEPDQSHKIINSSNSKLDFHDLRSRDNTKVSSKLENLSFAHEDYGTKFDELSFSHETIQLNEDDVRIEQNKLKSNIKSGENSIKTAHKDQHVVSPTRMIYDESTLKVSKSSSIEIDNNYHSKLQKGEQRSFSESSSLNKTAKLIPKTLKVTKSVDSLTSESINSSSMLDISSKCLNLSENHSFVSKSPSRLTNVLLEPNTCDNLQINSQADAETLVSTHVQHNNFGNKCTGIIDEFTQKWKEVEDLIKMEKEKLSNKNNEDGDTKVEDIKNTDDTINILEVEYPPENTITIDFVGDENEEIVSKCSEATDKNSKVVVLRVESISMSPQKIDEILNKFNEVPAKIYYESSKIKDNLLKPEEATDKDSLQTGNGKIVELEDFDEGVQSTANLSLLKGQINEEIEKTIEKEVKTVQSLRIEESSTTSQVQALSSQQSEEFDNVADENDNLVIDMSEDYGSNTQSITETSTSLQQIPVSATDSSTCPKLDPLIHHKSKKANSNWMAIPTGPSSIRITKTSLPNFKESEKLVKSRRNSILSLDSPGNSKKIENIQRSFSLQEPMIPNDLKSESKYSIGNRKNSTLNEPPVKDILVISKDQVDERNLEDQDNSRKSHTSLKHQKPKIKHVSKIHKKSPLHFKHKDFERTVKKNQIKSKTGIQSKVIASYASMVRSLKKNGDEIKVEEKSFIKEHPTKLKEFIKLSKNLIDDPNFFESGVKCTRAEPVMTRLRSVSLDSRKVGINNKKNNHFPNREAEWYVDSDLDSLDDDAVVQEKAECPSKLKINQSSIPLQGSSPSTQPATLQIQPSIPKSPQKPNHSVQIIDSFGNIISNLDIYRHTLTEKIPTVGLQKKFVFSDGSEVIIDDAGNIRKNSAPDVTIEITDKNKDPEIIDLDDISEDLEYQSTKNDTQKETRGAIVHENVKFVHPDGDLDHLLTEKLEILPNPKSSVSKSRSGSGSGILKPCQRQNPEFMPTQQVLISQSKISSPQNVPKSQNRDLIPQPILGPSTDLPELLNKRNSKSNEYCQRKVRPVAQTVTSQTANISISSSKSLAKEILMEKLKKKLKKMQEIRQKSNQECTVQQNAPLSLQTPQDSSDDGEYENLPELREIDDCLTNDELQFILAKRFNSQINPQKSISCDEMIAKLENLLIKITGTEKNLNRNYIDQQDSKPSKTTEYEGTTTLSDTYPIAVGFSNVNEVLKKIAENMEEKNNGKMQEKSLQSASQQPKNKIVIHPTYNLPKPRKYRSNKESMVRIFRVRDVINPTDNSQNTEVDLPKTKQHIIIVPKTNQLNVPQFINIPAQSVNMNPRLVHQSGLSQHTRANDQNKANPQIEGSNRYTFIDHEDEVLIIENNPPQILTQPSEDLHSGFSGRNLQQLNLNPQLFSQDQQRQIQKDSNILWPNQSIQTSDSSSQQSLKSLNDLYINTTTQATKIVPQHIQNKTQNVQITQCSQKVMPHMIYQNAGSSQRYHSQVNISCESQAKDNINQVKSSLNPMNEIMNQGTKRVNIFPQTHSLNQSFHQEFQSQSYFIQETKSIENVTSKSSNDKCPGLKVLSSESLNRKFDMMNTDQHQSIPQPSANMHNVNATCSYTKETPGQTNKIQVNSNKIPQPLQPPDSMCFSQSLKAIAEKVQSKDILNLASLIGDQAEDVIVLDESLEDEQSEAVNVNNNATIPRLIPLHDVMPAQMEPERSSHQKLSKVESQKVNKVHKQFHQERIHRPVPSQAILPKSKEKFSDDSLLNERRSLEAAPFVNVDLSDILNDAAQVKKEPVSVKKKRGRPPKNGIRANQHFKKVKTMKRKRGRKLGFRFVKDNLSKVIDKKHLQDISLTDQSISAHKMNKQSKTKFKYRGHDNKLNHAEDLSSFSSSLQPIISENVKNETEFHVDCNQQEEKISKSLSSNDSTVLAKVVQIKELDSISRAGSLAETEHLTDTDQEDVYNHEEVIRVINSTVCKASTFVQQTFDQSKKEQLLETSHEHIGIKFKENEQIGKPDLDEYSKTDGYAGNDMLKVPITVHKPNKSDSITRSCELFGIEDQNEEADRFPTVCQSEYPFDDFDQNNLSDNEDITPFYPKFPEVSVALERLTDEEIALAMSSIKRLESSSIYRNFANTYSKILDSKGISEGRSQDGIKFRKRTASIDEELLIPKRSQIATKSTFSSTAVKTTTNIENCLQNKRKNESSSEDSDSSSSQYIKRHRIEPNHYFEDLDYSPPGTSNKKPELRNTHQIVRPSDLDKFCNRDSDDDDDDEEEDEEMDNYGSSEYGTRIPTVSRMSQRQYKNYLSTIRTNENAESSTQMYIEVSDEETEVDTYSLSDDEKILKMPIVNKTNLIPKEKSILLKKGKKDESRKVSFYNSVFVRTFLSEDE
ncbi:unnamed protein product [Chironomus riparius]|uniref:FHA domain-containing protein n=1 Tax=Chironomus riparius TaxID=315576 RepID=A0A9N9SCD8_9DIPT|nr:unnamed protein product [Chironomus riparius]